MLLRTRQQKFRQTIERVLYLLTHFGLGGGGQLGPAQLHKFKVVVGAIRTLRGYSHKQTGRLGRLSVFEADFDHLLEIVQVSDRLVNL